MNIKKIIFSISIFVCLLLGASHAIAAEKTVIYFFWGQGCPRCADEESFFEKLQQKYSQLEIRYFEVYNSKENQDLFRKVAQAYNTSAMGVPMTFIGKDFIVGFASENITGKQIENLIQNCLDRICPSPGDILAAGGIDKCTREEEDVCISLFGREIKISSQSSLLFLGIILGLADGINPCMFSVLLFLLTYLLAIGSKRKAIKIGLVFTIGVFAIYFLFMLGMINLIGLIGVIQKIKIIVAVLALIAGLVMIKDFFAFGSNHVCTFSRFAPLGHITAINRLGSCRASTQICFANFC